MLETLQIEETAAIDSAPEPLYERALAIDEQVYGPEHPDVATDLNNLALLYHEQGKYEQAKPLYERTLRILEQTLGNEHLNTRAGRANYAALVEEMGQGQKHPEGDNI